MKALKIAVWATMILGGMGTLRAQTGDDIIQKHITAIGGTDKWNSVSSMKAVGVMNIGGMELNMTQTLLTDKAVRMDISAMGMTGYTIITPKEGWAYIPFQPGMDKVTPLPADQVKASQDKLNIKGAYLTDRSKIKSAEYIGMDTIKTLPCYKVKITDNDGNQQTAYFDIANYYLLQTDIKMNIQDMEQEVTASYSNFQKLPEGVVMPMTVSAEGGDITFKTIELNKPIDESIFKPTEPKSDAGSGTPDNK